MPAVETIAAAIAATILGVGYGIEKLEKRGIIRNMDKHRPEWARNLTKQIERQNDVLVLMAEQMDNVNERTAAEYLDHSRRPNIEDVTADDRHNA